MDGGRTAAANAGLTHAGSGSGSGSGCVRRGRRPGRGREQRHTRPAAGAVALEREGAGARAARCRAEGGDGHQRVALLRRRHVARTVGALVAPTHGCGALGLVGAGANMNSAAAHARHGRERAHVRTAAAVLARRQRARGGGGDPAPRATGARHTGLEHGVHLVVTGLRRGQAERGDCVLVRLRLVRQPRQQRGEPRRAGAAPDARTALAVAGRAELGRGLRARRQARRHDAAQHVLRADAGAVGVAGLQPRSGASQSRHTECTRLLPCAEAGADLWRRQRAAARLVLRDCQNSVATRGRQGDGPSCWPGRTSAGSSPCTVPRTWWRCASCS